MHGGNRRIRSPRSRRGVKPRVERFPLPPLFSGNERLFIEWFLGIVDDEQVVDELNLSSPQDLDVVKSFLETHSVTERNFKDKFSLTRDGISTFDDYVTALSRPALASPSASEMTTTSTLSDMIDTLQIVKEQIHELRQIQRYLKETDDFQSYVQASSIILRALERVLKMQELDPTLMLQEKEKEIEKVRRQFKAFVEFVISLEEEFPGLAEKITAYLFNEEEGEGGE